MIAKQSPEARLHIEELRDSFMLHGAGDNPMDPIYWLCTDNRVAVVFF